jgi:hypothetical protein
MCLKFARTALAQVSRTQALYHVHLRLMQHYNLHRETLKQVKTHCLVELSSGLIIKCLKLISSEENEKTPHYSHSIVLGGFELMS